MHRFLIPAVAIAIFFFLAFNSLQKLHPRNGSGVLAKKSLLSHDQRAVYSLLSSTIRHEVPSL